MQLAWRWGFCGVLAILGLNSALLAQPVAAALVGGTSANSTSTTTTSTCPDNSILGFVPWYSGLQCDSSGNISSAYFSNSSDSAETIATFIWTIILNIVSDILLAVGYIAMGMVIFAGFMILTAEGNPERMAKGRKMIIATGVGAAIAICATLGVRLVTGVFV